MNSPSFKLFGQLPWSDKKLALVVLHELVWTKALLSLLPFSGFQNFYVRRLAKKKGAGHAPQKIVRFVRAWACRLPLALNCLPQALVVRYLLGADSVCELKIGVSKLADGLHAHAWVQDAHGHVLIGESTTTFVPIWTMDRRGPVEAGS